MIISRTPFRISFFGGGTDYPDWYRRHGGSVLSTSIDKYCYITCRTLPPFFEHKTRVVYRKIEYCQGIEDIGHPAVRETLRFLDLHRGLELHHDGDLPARSGIGSSSAFTVGLLHSLYALQGKMPSKKQLATESMHIEQKMLKETVGSQDQVCAAYGGLNQINFDVTGEIEVRPLTLSPSRIEELNSHLMLFFTGIKRTASSVAGAYVSDLNRKRDLLKKMHAMVDQGVEILHGDVDICDFGQLLHESWMLKRRVGDGISNYHVDDLYQRARQAGAIGGKITGAGGGGFMLLFVPPADREKVRNALAGQIYVPFRFEFNGSQIIFYEPEREDYSELEKDRELRDISAFQELEALKTRTPIQDIPVGRKISKDAQPVT